MQWTPEAESAFEELKRALCEEPVLITPNFEKPFLLHTDASATGVGAVLSQLIDGEEHPVTFVSRKLKKHERNYATIEKECLAIKWAVHHLKYYLWGRRFTLITDHAPLKWMARNKDTNARVTRWFLDLQNYSFEVEHRPGRQIPHADALSRRHEMEEDTEVPRPDVELRGRVCGVSVPPTRLRQAGKHLGTRERQDEGGGVQRQRQPLGSNIGNRYFPRYVTAQAEEYTAALMRGRVQKPPPP